MKIGAAVVLFAIGCGGSTPPASPPPPGDWRADLECRADPQCPTRGPDCAPISPPPVLQVEQCGGTQQPPPTPDESAEYARRRARAIADRTWPCVCFCQAAERKRQEECSRIP